MIVLGKNKVDKRYNISDEGIITDLNGNVQELKIVRGRPCFKGLPVHRIIMYTFYGYRDGHKWDIHHLDENKLNNSLNNLVYLTCSSHTILHKKGAHWSLSLETREKMSRAKKGNKNPNFGKHHSKEAKIKIIAAHKGKHWFNDGRKNYQCRECPPGCVPGRIKWKN